MRGKRTSKRTPIKCWIYNDPSGKQFYPLDEAGDLIHKFDKPTKNHQMKIVCPTVTLPSKPAEFIQTIAQEMPELSFSPDFLFPSIDDVVGFGFPETAPDLFETWL
jgi:hypothetical protein